MKKIQIELCDDYTLASQGGWKHDGYMYWDESGEVHEIRTDQKPSEVVRMLHNEHPNWDIRTRTRYLKPADTEDFYCRIKEAKNKLINTIIFESQRLSELGYNEKQIKALLHEANR